MEFPKRKIVRLQDYDYSMNGAYFVTICTYERQNLFGEIVCDVGANPCVRPKKSSEMIEQFLLKLQDKFQDVIINSYVVMPDHMHFILCKVSETGEHMGSPLQQILQWFKTQTTNEYIKGVKSGLYSPFNKHIWQRSYYEHIIRNKQDFEEIQKYIYENPYKLDVKHYFDY